MCDLGHPRRRSVDVGGLALALGAGHSGHGWGGWEETDKGETRYAEALIDVRAHTETIVNPEPRQLSPSIHIDDHVRSRLIKSLESWHFEPLKLPEEEVLACTFILFESIFRMENMQEDAGISLTQIATFLQHLRQIYRNANTYHNFQHALDVFQATYYFLYSAGAVPPISILSDSDGRLWKPDKNAARDPYISALTNMDLLALYITAVGHDVGHPGLTNAFLKNAKTALAEVYDDKSILEQMHYALMIQIMRANGLAELIDRAASGQLFRKTLLMIVIATDMGVHNQFMQRFQDMIDGKIKSELERRVLVCQAIIKCADISNPSRPYIVSQDWAAALESEWASQQLLEEHLNLPASVKPASDPTSEINTQLFFIGTFARPLFELTAKGIPQMQRFVVHIQENLGAWKEKQRALVKQAKSRREKPFQTTTQPEDFLTAFPPTLPRSFRSEHERRTSSECGSEFFSSSSGSRPPSVASGASHYETCSSSPSSPSSPLRNDVTPPLLPRLEITTSTASPPSSQGRPSSINSASSYLINPSQATTIIRAAYNASVRKKKSSHRTSWNPSGTGVAEMVGRSPPSPSTPSQSIPSLSVTSTSPQSPPSAATTASPLTPAFVRGESHSILKTLYGPLPP